MRARDLTKGNIAYHNELNPAVWDGNKLRVDVRYKLLEIAKRFIEYLEVPDFKLKDVILRGSLCNYNYTQYSDFDLHLVTDYADLDCDITEQFYMAKKRIWNDEHDITIKGYEVELYVEDVDAKNVSAGTYSVLDARWLSTPTKENPNIDERAVSAKARGLMTEINRARRSNDVEEIQRLQDKIKAMRQAGLDRAGEFSTENLAFKIIRNKGYLDKLYKAKNTAVDNKLSLDESQALLDPEVEEFLDGLTPDDVGVDEVGDYIIHYEGFTDQCQDSKEYQDNPEAVFNDVWGDFKRRMGDQDPINYGIVGSHDYPIVYSVFRR